MAHFAVSQTDNAVSPITEKSGIIRLLEGEEEWERGYSPNCRRKMRGWINEGEGQKDVRGCNDKNGSFKVPEF